MECPFCKSPQVAGERRGVMPDAARAAGFKWPFPKFTLWERLILFFLPTKITHENDLDGTTICRLFYKTWKGKIYIIREEFIDAE